MGKAAQQLNRIIKLCSGLALLLLSLRTLFVIDLQVDHLVSSTTISFPNSDGIEPDQEHIEHQAPLDSQKGLESSQGFIEETKDADPVSMRQKKDADPVSMRNSSDRTLTYPVSMHSKNSTTLGGTPNDKEHASLGLPIDKAKEVGAPANTTLSMSGSTNSTVSHETSQLSIEEPEDADPVSIHSNKSASPTRETSSGEEHASPTDELKKFDGHAHATDRQVSALYDDNLIKMPDDKSRLDIPDLNGESFAACLLVMDENPRLNEWLAYHYYTLPLRHLVLAADPRSKTSANDILDKWRPFINITVWKDDDYMEGKWLARAKKSMHPNFNNTNDEATKIHRQRQARFIESCSHRFKKANRTWVAYHDTDEYVVLDSHKVNNTQALMREPGSILRFVKELREKDPNNTHFSKPCISLPRTTFGAIESTHEEMTKDVPPYVDAKQFNTLRFRHSAAHNSDANGPPKGIADVSLMPSNHKHFAVHRPLGHLCSSKWVQETFLNVHHYIGSWELYSYRQNDARAEGRTKAKWEKKSRHKQKMNNDDTRPWIKGFTDWEPAHKHLLQDTGPPPHVPSL